MIAPPSYLGDGVYASVGQIGLVLTTGHHDPAQADNTIVFEPEVLAALEKYISKFKENSIRSTHHEEIFGKVEK